MFLFWCVLFLLFYSKKKSFPKFWLGVKLMPNTKPIMTLAVLTFPVSSILIASSPPRNYFLASLLTPHPPLLDNYSSPSPFLCLPPLASKIERTCWILFFYHFIIITFELKRNDAKSTRHLRVNLLTFHVCMQMQNLNNNVFKYSKLFVPKHA